MNPAAAPPGVLTVHVCTACVVGIDDGDALSVDLATVTDEFGLPYIPRHRIAARLRDAALTVLAETGFDDAEVATATQLLGAGLASGAQRRALTVGHAELPRSMQVAVAAAVTAHHDRFRGKAPLHAHVRAALTTILTSTRRDRRGAPVPGTLRQIEAVIPGVVLQAPLHWQHAPTAAQLGFLARCVLAVDQIGHGQSDGHGRVDCALDGDRHYTAQLAFGTQPDGSATPPAAAPTDPQTGGGRDG